MINFFYIQNENIFFIIIMYPYNQNQQNPQYPSPYYN